MSNDAPQIRFKGFTDAWEQRKLGEEFYKVNERNDGSFGKQHWISVAKMYFQDPEKVQSNNIDTRTYVMRIGDIAFEGHPNAEFAFGRFVANDIGDGVVSELFPIYRHKVDYDNNYWKYAIQLETIMASIFAKSITSSGNSSNKLNEKHFLRQVIFVPNFDEQQKIGTFFNTLNNLITLHKRKLDGLKELKRGYLQQMFPKVGESTPLVRFTGFTERWVEKKLGDYFSERSERSGEGDLISVTINSGIMKANELDRKIISGEDKSNYKVVKVADIAYNSMRMWQGASGCSPYDGILSPAYTVITPSKNAHSHFFAYAFKRLCMIQMFQKNSQGLTSDTWNLKYPAFSRIGMFIPSLNEQIKIADFLEKLDDQIVIQQQKLNQLKQLKSAYLQKMFV